MAAPFYIPIIFKVLVNEHFLWYKLHTPCIPYGSVLREVVQFHEGAGSEW